MRGHVNKACWFSAQMRDKSLEEKTRNAWCIVNKAEQNIDKQAKRDLKAQKKQQIKIDTEKKLQDAKKTAEDAKFKAMIDRQRALYPTK